MKQKRLISFAPKMLRWLQRTAAQMETSVSELVRRAVEEKMARIAKKERA